ncbi:MAG: sugar O-acetyltransferase [Terasakiella sp.]|nr:sugar O-acetyltransferase [Terasakiella sp.]
MDIDKTLEALSRGEWVRAGAKDSPEISELLGRCAAACHRYNAMPPDAAADRDALLRSLLGECGPGAVIHSPFRCDFGFNIHIGDNFVGNFNLAILDEARVTIGDNVMIGPNCSLITITHALDAAQRSAGVMTGRPITIGDDVWIAAGVTVLPGVSIGASSVIGAGSVVVKDIPAGVLAVGSPCKVVRPITAADVINQYI